MKSKELDLFEKQKRPKKFSIEERNKIVKFLQEGLTYNEIAKKLNRTYQSIKNEISRKGGKYNYKVEENIKEKINQKELLYKLEQRIISLEMQVEILSETIKELIKK